MDTPVLFGSDISLPRNPTEPLHAVPKRHVDALTGDLSTLKTENKGTLVDAVNELWDVLFPPDLKLTVVPTSSVMTFTLPFGAGELSKIQSIDWGDGSTELAMSHTYSDTAERKVKVNIVPGSVFTEFTFYNKTGSKILKSIDVCDIECSTTSLNTFRGCSALLSVCVGVFAKCLQVTNFSSCFYDCSSLTSIPSGLFDKNTEVTNFYCCFYGCSSLTTIPSGLFDKNTAVTNFSNCFSSCSSLTSIPQGLFDKNTVVTTFSSCFSSCSKITDVASDAFGTTPNSTRNVSFAQCFYNCSAITSNVPTLWTLFTAAGVTKSGCFTGVTQTANYTDIPLVWRT